MMKLKKRPHKNSEHITTEVNKLAKYIIGNIIDLMPGPTSLIKQGGMTVNGISSTYI